MTAGPIALNKCIHVYATFVDLHVLVPGRLGTRACMVRVCGAGACACIGVVMSGAVIVGDRDFKAGGQGAAKYYYRNLLSI